MSATDHADVTAVANQYAYALDDRDWAVLDDVFADDVVARYGDETGFSLSGRSAIVEMIRSNLDGCGVSQHLMGNHCVTIDGDTAKVVCKARVIHFGVGVRANLEPYEAFGVYRFELQRTSVGWRVFGLPFDVHHEVGERGILQSR